MLTILNFESHINSVILQRGQQYYSKGYVAYIEETGDNIWSAEVEGSETYAVEVTLKKDNEIISYNCDCPYDSSTCKHVIAVFFALRDEMKKTENKTNKITKKDVFDNLLQSVSTKEYQDFIRSYAAKNKNFKTDFELFFAGKDNRIDVEKKYTELVQKLIRKYSDRGYIDYRASFGLSNEANSLLETGLVYVGKNNFRNAFALAKAVLRPMMDVVESCDDSNGNIGGSIENAIHLLETITISTTAAIDIKEQLYRFLQTELNDKVYFDYGDFGYNLFSVFQSLAVQLNKPEKFLDFITAQIAKLTGQYDGYRKEYFQKRKIEFLQQTGKVAEAEKLVQQNMDIVEVRLDEVNKAIKRKDFVTAKKLIAGGIKVAESKDHPGTVAQWHKELLRIALLEKDIPTVRHYTKHFAFDRWFSTEYYNQWKATFTAAEWREEIEKHIEKTIYQVTKEWNSSKNKFWKPAHPPLLTSLAPIYIQEKYWDRLLPLVQQANNLNTTLEYHSHLVKSYPDELLAIYLPALEEFGLKSNSRSEYADLVNKMKKIIKDIPHGKEKILDTAKRLKEKFSSRPRRPAMIEELNKIL
ncbi:SWIM zinc finger family protein [Terrimonas pollutisoli]|uniref:SWIM zinc finger family protein n=1 Tax=Terrimonas pollutisoli TaxID=3034147 RepID=UPI0023ECCD5A|nr:SWIM zinc finger family protein [Terrimonas sp. H1YJ31]